MKFRKPPPIPDRQRWLQIVMDAVAQEERQRDANEFHAFLQGALEAARKQRTAQ
jgi:hypothetical protein